MRLRIFSFISHSFIFYFYIILVRKVPFFGSGGKKFSIEEIQIGMREHEINNKSIKNTLFVTTWWLFPFSRNVFVPQ